MAFCELIIDMNELAKLAAAVREGEAVKLITLPAGSVIQSHGMDSVSGEFRMRYTVPDGDSATMSVAIGRSNV